MATGKICTSSQNGSDMVDDFTCMPCIDVGKSTEALFQCVECRTYYCQRCVENHNRFVKNHTVLDKTATKSGRGQTQRPLSLSVKFPTITCDEHKGEVIKMYCRNHDVVCCSVCTAVNHRSCPALDYLPKLDRSLKHQERARAKANLENVKRDMQNLKSERLRFLQDTKKREDETINDIRNCKKLLQKRLEEIERFSVTVVKTKCKQIIDDVNGEVNHIDKMLKDIDLHLRRSSTSDNDNKTQRFVNVKLMQMQSSKGKAESNEIRRKPFEKVEYKLDTSITSYFEDVTTLGILTVSEQKLTPSVNILNFSEKESSSSIASSLQAELEENGVSSKFIKLRELDANRYTVVFCDLITVDKTLSDIKENLHSKTILVPMYEIDPSSRILKRFEMTPEKEKLMKDWNLAGIKCVSYDKHDKNIGGKCFAGVINLIFNVIYT